MAVVREFRFSPISRPNAASDDTKAADDVFFCMSSSTFLMRVDYTILRMNMPVLMAYA